MNKFALMGIAAAAATASMVAAAPAEAARFTVGGQQYDITTEFGTFSSLQTTLESQVWWGNQALAIEFADVVNTGLGLPNATGASGGNDLGPIFAYDPIFGGVWSTQLGGFAGPGVHGTITPGVTYAVATLVEPESVPEPMTLLGLGAVGLVGAGSALKRQRSAEA